MTTKQNRGFQAEGAMILRAQLAAQRLHDRVTAERRATLALSRDELQMLARALTDVAQMAERYHLERATAGALPPDAFPEPIA